MKDPFLLCDWQFQSVVALGRLLMFREHWNTGVFLYNPHFLSSGKADVCIYLSPAGGQTRPLALTSLCHRFWRCRWWFLS